MSADTAIMPIPGPIDPVPVPRAAQPRADGRVELVGRSKDAIRSALEEAGLEPRQRSSAPSRSGTGSTIAESAIFPR